MGIPYPMSLAPSGKGIRRITGLALLTVASVVVVFGLVIAAIWLWTLLTGAFLRKAELFLLTGVEVAYAVAAVLSFLGVVVLGLYWLRLSRTGKRHPSVARWLLLCSSLAFAVTLSEVTIATWQNHRLTHMPMPVGGLGPGEAADPTWRPPGRLSDCSLPTGFPDPPGDRTIDMTVLGGSSAEGVPFEEWLSVGKIIAWQLEKAIPARPVRLSVLARSGDTLEGQHHALAKLVHRPDLFCVYCGHNEFCARFNWNRDRRYYLDADDPDLVKAQIIRVEQLSSVCRLIRQEMDKCSISIPPSRASKRKLVGVPVYSQVEYSALVTDFRERLESIVTYAHNLGALVVLIIPSSNDAGYEPNRSSLPAATPRAQRVAFALAVLAARNLEVQDPAAAMVQYRALLAAQPGFAEVHYRLARLLEQSEEWDEAYQHYIAARDLDVCPQRILTPFQNVYREVAARHNCILIDCQAYFHTLGNQGFLDDDLFQDAVHPSLRGYIAIAQAVLHALQRQRAFGWPSDHPAPIIDPETCAAHFGIASRDWASICRWCTSFYAMVGSLRYDDGERMSKSELYEDAMSRVKRGDPPESLGIPNIGIPRPVPLPGAPGPASQDIVAPERTT